MYSQMNKWYVVQQKFSLLNTLYLQYIPQFHSRQKLNDTALTKVFNKALE